MELLISAFFVALSFLLSVVLCEERIFERRFGAEYHDYCARVGRWLPRFRWRQTA